MSLTINHQTNDISASSGSMTIDGAAVGGGGGAMEFIASTGAISNGTTDIVFTSSHFDSSKYRNYVFKFANLIPVSDSSVRLRVSYDNGSNYQTGDIYKTGPFTIDDYLKLMGWSVGGAANESGASGEFYLFNPHDTTAYTQASSFLFGEWFNGGLYIPADDQRIFYIQNTSSINNIKIYLTTGNFESGFVDMYGLKKS